MSYWPPPPERISVTISSDEPAYFACTVQPRALLERLHPLRLRVALPRDHVQRAGPSASTTPAAGNASIRPRTAASSAHMRFVI